MFLELDVAISSETPFVWFCSVELDNKATLSDHILNAVLGLLKKEVPEHGRHLQQYFNFFLMYSTIGPPEVGYLFNVVVLITYKTYIVFNCKSAYLIAFFIHGYIEHELIQNHT